jgi:signal transduction histidine kinase/ligand-binding sensor domain-containing protein
MLRSIKKKLIPILFSLLPIAITLFTSSCSGVSEPSKEQPPPSPSVAQVTDFPTSAKKISPGQHLRFEAISLEDGLSQSTVFCILQDSQGFMWFGTEDGLNKYDGYTFTVYKNDSDDSNSLGSNWITAIFEDDSGILWIGTRDGGLDRYDQTLDQFTHYRNNPEDPTSLSDDEITALYQDRDGVLWIGTGGGGLDRFDQENERFIHYQHDPDDPNSLSSNAVSAIYDDQEGTLWIGTADRGLNRLVMSEDERWRHYVNDPSDPHSLSHDNISAIFEDQSGVLWVGTKGGGLNRFDQESKWFIHYQYDPDDRESISDDEITAIYQDREGVLWIGTFFGGVNILDPEKEIFTHYQNVPGDPYSLSSDIVESIFQDREGVLWFGTIAGGINKLSTERWYFAHYKNNPDDPNSLGDNMVRALHQTPEGDIWIGSMFGGLDRFDRANGTWVHYRYDPNDPSSLSNDWVSAIYLDHSGVLWIGTRSALDRFNPETDTFTHYQADPDGQLRSRSNNITAIYEGHESDFWIGTADGLFRFDRENENWNYHYHHDPDDPSSLTNIVLSILEDQDGVLWIGTAGGGLDRLDLETETSANYQNDPDDPHSLSQNHILSIVQDLKGKLWIATLDGFNKFDPAKETFIHYREKNGLPNDTIYCVLEDRGGNLWASTNNGLSRFDPYLETFNNYGVKDGLQSNEFNGSACNVSESGEMLFGGINGFNAFFPEHIQDNPTNPPIVLTSLVHSDEQVILDHTDGDMSEVTFEWPDNAFEFEYAALSFAQPEKNQYAYYLEGFEETWNEVGTRRSGQYTNLPGGTYTLRVKGSNNDGVWNEAGTALKITIVPPFWGTWWFIGIAILTLAGIAYGGYRLRIRSLEARGRELEMQVTSRTKELSALNEVANVVSRSLNLDQVLTNALDKTLAVVEIEAGGIYLLQEDEQTLNIAVHKGLSAQIVAEVDNLKVGEGFSGQVVQTGEPLVVQNLSKDPRLTRSIIKESGFHSLAIAPLVSRGQVLGTLFVINSDVREFSQQDIELILSIGGQIGVAVENAKLYERAQQVAVVEERQRMARELHDSVTQSLYSLTLFSEAARHLAEEQGSKSIEQQIKQIGVIGTQALKEMRLLVYELQPPELERDGLVRALRRRLETVEGRAGVAARVEVEELARLPGKVELEFFRIAQEALNNALKHAAAASVVVYLRQEGEQVEMEIVDDGVGFEPGSIKDSAGMGLVSIQERTEQLGGIVTVNSKLGEGTRIKVTLANVDNIEIQDRPNEGEANE